MNLLKLINEYLTIKQSGEFDATYYSRDFPDISKNPIIHFMTEGWKEGRNPSPNFDTSFYLENNPDVRSANINPLVHYIKHGKKEGRKTFPKNVHPQNSTLHSTTDRKENPVIKIISTKPKNVTVYFHIGDSKSGSSIIQNFLDVNRTNLIQNHQCLYPNLSSEIVEIGRYHNHGAWYTLVKDHEVGRFTKDISQVIHDASAKSLTRVILSFEQWLLEKNFPNFLSDLTQNKDNFEIKLVCFIRRTDLWCESAWKQWGLKSDASLEDYLKDPEKHLRLKTTMHHLDKLADIVGQKNIIIKPYEKQQLHNGLITEFLKLIGIDHAANQWNDTENINLATNSGFNRDVLEILHLCNPLFKDKNDNHLFDLFSTLMNGHFIKQPFESYALLSPKERARIYEMNLPYEKFIAKKYLNRDDGKLFFDPEPDENEPWEAYSGLNLEKALPIIVNMIDQTNQRIDQILSQKNKTDD